MFVHKRSLYIAAQTSIFNTTTTTTTINSTKTFGCSRSFIVLYSAAVFPRLFYIRTQTHINVHRFFVSFVRMCRQWATHIHTQHTCYHRHSMLSATVIVVIVIVFFGVLLLLLYYYHYIGSVCRLLLYLEFVEKIKRMKYSVCIWTSCCFSVKLQTVRNTLRTNQIHWHCNLYRYSKRRT